VIHYQIHRFLIQIHRFLIQIHLWHPLRLSHPFHLLDLFHPFRSPTSHPVLPTCHRLNLCLG
jgi:hypothetical protein